MSMIIHAYILVWNESDIIRLVIKHYQKFCDKITILDNHSTDGTDRIAREMGCEVRKFGTQFFDDAENMKIKNECWKGSNADWVIVCDCDEILWAGHFKEMRRILGSKIILDNFGNPTIFETYGWQIMSDEMPKDDLLEITNGYHFANYSKNIIFNPQRIQEMNYNPGAHRINPVGDVVYSQETLYVLHYKHIGGLQRTIKRYKEYQPRMSKNNRKNGWGIHYNRTPASLEQEWNERMAISKPLV
jgi:hypothetical protein